MSRSTNTNCPRAEDQLRSPAEATAARELTLDPPDDAAWDEFAEEAHRILDDTLRQLRTLRSGKTWQPLPAATQKAIDEAPLPAGERSLGVVYAEVTSRILPYTSANRHPRAWGWVRGQSTPVAMLADLVASAANAHVGSGFSAPVHVEATVIRWLAEALEMRAPGAPNGPSGLLTSGATMANLLGLAVARHARALFNVREEGLSGQPRMLLYASSETHVWARKAVELLGLGRRSLRLVPADERGRLALPLLRAEIAADRAQGLLPFAVLANAGTVNTGAIDDLGTIRSLCTAEQLWMHVDGAFGALLKLSPVHRDLIAGLEAADSVAFDLHKWMSLPFETGCLLVRDPELHRAAFASETAYLQPTARGMLAGNLSFSNLGIESSRSFKALRVWMQLSVHGFRKHGALIEQNMAQAAYLEELIRKSPELELLAPRTTNIVCFRYRFAGGERDALNRELVLRLQESGHFVVSGTTLASGAYTLRVAITNHRSRREDFAALAAAVVEAGRKLSQARESEGK